MVSKNPYADVLNLSVEERLALMEYIWDSIADHPAAIQLTPAQREELDSRLQEYERNPTLGSPWAEVKARILKRK